MSSFQKQLKRAKRQFMIVSSTWTSNKKKIHSLENLCKRSGGKTFSENGIFWNRDIKWGKKRPYCVSTCVCFCNTAHSLNKGPRMCAIRAPAFAPNSPIICATVCDLADFWASSVGVLSDSKPAAAGIGGPGSGFHGKGKHCLVRDLKAAKDFP